VESDGLNVEKLFFPLEKESTMKSIIAGFSAFCLLALAAPAIAHHESTGANQGYLVFWKGIPPKKGPALAAKAASPEIWRHAFVSKFPILGASLPALHP
jgi:hypothetical protein